MLEPVPPVLSKDRFFKLNGKGVALNEYREVKKVLFISYSNENLNKVKLITKELAKHKYIVPLIVANNREPNKALVKKVTTGIKSAYRVIAILTQNSIRTQWINQEIGYAFGKGIPVIPIIEQNLLDNDALKGFIHKQIDCPYTYYVREGLMMRDENKLFMKCFRLLIKDLENEFLKEMKKIAEKQKRAANKKQPNLIRTTIPLKDLGSLCESGEKCPESGIWSTIGVPKRTISILKGNIMPPVGAKSVKWKLMDYKTVESIKISM
jgi:hypothetical protein